MTRDRRDGVELPSDVPNYATHSGKFMWRLLAAWIAMGFRARQGCSVMAGAEKVAMENPNSPGRVVRVDGDKYHAMKDAMLAILPTTAPGLTVKDLKERLLPLLPEKLFPGGAKAGWWLKGVQLDLEAKKVIVREDTKPLRLHRL